jgi:hypothetical protein
MTGGQAHGALFLARGMRGEAQVRMHVSSIQGISRRSCVSVMLQKGSPARGTGHVSNVEAWAHNGLTWEIGSPRGGQAAVPGRGAREGPMSAPHDKEESRRGSRSNAGGWERERAGGRYEVGCHGRRSWSREDP